MEAIFSNHEFLTIWEELENRLDNDILSKIFKGTQKWTDYPGKRYYTFDELEKKLNSDHNTLPSYLYFLFKPLIANHIRHYKGISWFCIYFLNEIRQTHDFFIFYPKVSSNQKSFERIYNFANLKTYYQELDNSSSILFDSEDPGQRKQLSYSYFDIENEITSLSYRTVKLFDIENINFDSIHKISQLIEISDEKYQNYSGDLDQLLKRNNDLYKVDFQNQAIIKKKKKKLLRYYLWLAALKKYKNFSNYYYFPSFLHARSKVGGIVLATNDSIPREEIAKIQYYSNRIFSSLALVYVEKLKSNLEEVNLKSAIISILVDSFSHNISAHSLVALELWFRKRAEYLERKFHFTHVKDNEYKFTLEGDSRTEIEDVKLLDIPDYQIQNFHKLFSQRLPAHLDFATWHLIKFLRDKAAFWSGVTRDIPFGGESKTFYDVLWNDLSSNSLYLGTIAHSEKINRINIYVKYKDEEIGEFAVIDLKLIEYEENYFEGRYNNKAETADGQSIYNLVRPGTDRNQIQEYLKNESAFFPGGIVGIHSFLTIVENTLRNIKHYKSTPDFKSIQNNGINLCFEIKPAWLFGSDKTKKAHKEQLFKICICLNHNNKLVEDRKSVVHEMNDNLALDILDKYQKPKLGGSSQDKICSSMLLNNRFQNVNNYSTKRDKYYNNKANRNWISVVGVPDKTDESVGLIKREFYIWQSEFIFHLKDETSLENENISRFKFIYIEENDENYEKLFLKARENGIIRIITKADLENSIQNEEILKRVLEDIENGVVEEKENVDKDDSYSLIYNTWNFKLHANKIALLYFPNNLFGYIEQGILTHGRSDPKIEELQDKYGNDISNCLASKNYQSLIKNRIIVFKHGNTSNPKFSIDHRSQGKLIAHHYNNDNNFCNGVSYAPELVESLFLRTIILDNRVKKRTSKIKTNFVLPRLLNCFIYNENTLERILNNKICCDIFIVHLTAVEDISKYKKNFNLFLEDLFEKINPEFYENFILVITTGRGRAGWYNSIINEEFKRKVLFRPIESFLSAIEDANSIKDDFELKYNITKVIFGS